MGTEEQLEARLETIESKLALQEDLAETLNKIVYQQQKKIDELEALCVALATRLKDTQAQNQARPIDERPPHY
jgi:SlyX protein